MALAAVDIMERSAESPSWWSDMMIFHSRFAAALVVVAAPFFAITPAEAQKAATDSDEFFKKHTIVHLNLEIGPKEMDSLRREQRKYVSATLKEGDKAVAKIYKNVG